MIYIQSDITISNNKGWLYFERRYAHVLEEYFFRARITMRAFTEESTFAILQQKLLVQIEIRIF